MEKQIGGAGYTGSYVVILFKNGERKFIENCDTDQNTVNYYAEAYENVKEVHGYEKRFPFQSAEKVSVWKA